MSPATAIPVIPADCLGATAKKVLAAHGDGEVLAVFKRSFYARFGDEVVCVGPTELGAGPLNILCRSDTRFAWPQLAPGLPANRSGSALTIGSVCRIDCSAAKLWQPRYRRRIDRAALRQGLARLATEMRHVEPGGLGALILPMLSPETAPGEDALLRRAYPAMQALQADLFAIPRRRKAVAGNVACLVGLGPGLTPSGDDFLGGMMAAMSFLGRKDIARQIAAIALPAAREGTNLISYAHMRCAAAGQMSAVLWDVIVSLCEAGEDLSAALQRAARVGHTSGWDMSAGAAAACAAVCARSRTVGKARA